MWKRVEPKKLKVMKKRPMKNPKIALSGTLGAGSLFQLLVSSSPPPSSPFSLEKSRFQKLSLPLVSMDKMVLKCFFPATMSVLSGLPGI